MKASLKSIWNKACRTAALNDVYTPEPVMEALERAGWQYIVNKTYLPVITAWTGPGYVLDTEIVSPAGVSSKKDHTVISQYHKARNEAVRAYFDRGAPSP